jgi:hypothetical protein
MVDKVFKGFVIERCFQDGWISRQRYIDIILLNGLLVRGQVAFDQLYDGLIIFRIDRDGNGDLFGEREAEQVPAIGFEDLSLLYYLFSRTGAKKYCVLVA